MPLDRTTNIAILINQTTTIQRVATSQKMISVFEHTPSKRVEVNIESYDSEGLIEARTFIITGYDYDLLVSESPEFAPNKPANDYRKEDLWYMIDKIRVEQQTPLNE